MSDEGDWMLVGLDEKVARRQGVPARIPVPKKEIESIVDRGLSVEVCRGWVKDFLTNSEAGKDGRWRKKNFALVTAFEAFLDKGPIWERAQKAFTDREFDKAITGLKRIVAMDPDDHAARMNLGNALANQGDYAGALKAFKAVSGTFGGDPEFHTSVAHIHVAQHDREAAIDELVLALEAAPDFQPALDVMVELGVLAPIYENPRDATSLTYVRADAVVEYLTGRWDAPACDLPYMLEQLAYHEREHRPAVALAAAERALALAGDAAPEAAVLGRIAALRALGRVDEALVAAGDYADKHPTSAPALVELAKTLAAAGKAEEARVAIVIALAADPGDLAALAFRFFPADMNDLEKMAAALPDIAAFAAEHPGVAGAVRSLGRAYLALGRPEEAMPLFARALTLTPNDDDLRAEYWSELGKLSLFELILADAATVGDLGKRDWKLRWNEAEALLGTGKRVEARAAFTAINFDDTLHVDVRKRAKRAVKSLDETPAAG